MYNIITISREYGSGGRYVGKLLAEKLGVPFYDKELIHMLAEKSNYSSEYIEKHEDTHVNSLLFSLSTEGVFMNNPYDALTPNDRIFFAQNEVIKELAEKGPCVIVGRSADYILKDRDDVLSVFVTCDMENRIKRAVEHYGIAEKDAPKLLKRKDKARANKYNYYTDLEWGEASNYDLTVNTGTFGVQKCAEIIADCCK